MIQEELFYKAEYMEFTRLLKIRIDIFREQSMIDSCQKNVNEMIEGSDEFERIHKRIISKQQNIEDLINLVISDLYLDTDQKIAIIDYKIMNDLPKVITKLIDGKYNFDWSFSDYEFDYSMLKMEPKLKEAYRNQVEFQKLELSEREEEISLYHHSSIDNPIYFDLYYLALRDDSYLPFLNTIIQYRFYDPNRLDCLPSNLPFYGRIFKFGDQSLISAVLLDERTNFNLLVNGSDELKYMISKIAKQYHSSEILTSDFSLLSTILREKEISVIDTTRFIGDIRTDNCSDYISHLITNFSDCDLPEVQDLLEYFVSDKAIEKQLYISKYPSFYRDLAIDTYCKFIEERRGKGIDGISKLKMLKLYE